MLDNSPLKSKFPSSKIRNQTSVATAKANQLLLLISCFVTVISSYLADREKIVLTSKRFKVVTFFFSIPRHSPDSTCTHIFLKKETCRNKLTQVAEPIATIQN